MKTPLGTEVDLGLGHIVLDGVPDLHESVQQPPVISDDVYCGHGRPSQLLLSSISVAIIQPLAPCSARDYSPCARENKKASIR